MKLKFYNISLWLSIILVSMTFIFQIFKTTNTIIYYEELVFFILSVIISCFSLFLLKRKPNFQAVLQLFACLTIFGLLLRYLIVLIINNSKLLTIPVVLIGALFFEYFVFLSLQQLANLITGKTARIISTLILMILMPASSLTILYPIPLIKNNTFTNAFILSGFLGTLLFIPVVIYLGKKWQLASFNFTFSHSLTLRNIILLIIICIAFILWSRYHKGTNMLDSLFQYNTKWAPHYSLNYFLTYFEAGVAEELTFRYLIFFILYKGLTKVSDTKRLWYAFFISTVLFGGMHFLNLGSYGSGYLGGVFYQFLLASFTGAMFLTSYLYSGSILVPIIFHYAYDVFGVAALPAAKLNAFTFIIDKQAGYPLMYYIIAILFVAYFMSGSRLQTVKQNLQRMCISKNDLLINAD